MPFPGRSILVAAAVAGAALGAGPAVGAKHRKHRLTATKARAHGHVPARAGSRPLVGTLPAATTPGTTPASTDPVTTTPAPSCPTALGVSEGEYYTHLSRTALCPGSILVELRNAGEDPHNLEIVDVESGSTVATWDDVEPGDAVSKRLTLAAGTYRLFCSLPTHDEKGMHAVISVG
jgi:plastocyanin